MIGPHRAYVLIPLPCPLAQVAEVALGIPEDIHAVVRTVIVGDQRMLLIHDQASFKDSDWPTIVPTGPARAPEAGS